jgi:hypothetical protein
MIKEVIYELKRDYNSEFTALEAYKQDQLYQIKEKMEAIADLQSNLKQ